MDTFQLIHALKQDPTMSRTFCGMFPSDKLPRTIDKKQCGFIANTDASSEPGTHWVAFYFPTVNEAEFFDSYGHPPEHYKDPFADPLLWIEI